MVMHHNTDTKHLMLVPSMDCPASCAYCFGPHTGSSRMGADTVEAVIRWQQAIDQDSRLEITFHGGEPLVPGFPFYQMALPRLQSGLAARQVRFAMQSNLWLLTDELANLLKTHNVAIGTSLDGPEEINDTQRGGGYFRRTMAGIERARAHGLDIGCICTFTHQSLPHMDEILDFFISEGLNFTLHAALPGLNAKKHPTNGRWSLSSDEHGDLLVQMLDLYLAHTDRVRIGTLDSLCRSVAAGHGGICTFGDCLGGYLAVDPDGRIYPCQRFAGNPNFALGSVHEDPSIETLSASPTWKRFQARHEHINETCGDCNYLDLCRGGCPYNALADGGGTFKQLRDPHCGAYQRIFQHITDRALAEVFSPENMAAVVNTPKSEHGLLQQGRLLALMRDGPHPYETAGHARLILASVALASTGDPHKATHAFEQLGLVTRPARTLAGMQSLFTRLTTPPQGLNNLYLHITFACPLHCTHCYADADADAAHTGAMPVPAIIQACRDAAALGFRHAVITGGEPLVHPRRLALLDALAALRKEVKPLLTVLRTSLSMSLGADLIERLAWSTDEVVVSLDGDRETHDQRRGAGSYEQVLNNLQQLVAVGGDSELSLAAVLPLEQVNGAPGESVRNLAKELGIRRTRFRPLLPLGRAAASKMDIMPETLWGHIDPQEMLGFGFTPVTSCGIGQNLYVEPDGKAYPCYAWHSPDWLLGSLDGPNGLTGILSSPGFQDLRFHTVNSNLGCRACALRYLCGGACRAWSRLADADQADLDAAPLDCEHLRRRAESLLASALAHLVLTHQDWYTAGLQSPVLDQ
jgi:uncharacterized protein